MSCCEKIPTRYTIGVMIYMCVLVSFTLQVNLSVNIVDMVPVVVNGTETVEKETLGWSAYERALVLGGYSWGYIVANIMGGLVVQKLGPRNTVILGQLGSAILTFLSPLFAKMSFIALTITRIALGFLSGFLIPAVTGLIANWAVPNERGKFTSAMIGGTIGTMVAWSILGVLIESYGWEWGFYFFAITAVLFCLPWLYIVYDTPDEHPRIEKSEKQFIIDGIQKNDRTKLIPPYFRIVTNVPWIAGAILAFGNNWGIFFILNSAPTFIANVLKYNLGSTGLLSSITYIVRSCTAILFGIIGDFILRRKILSVNTLRKSFVTFSHILPGLLLLALTTTSNPIVALTLMIISIGLNGSSVLTSAINCHDLTPNYASTAFGLTNGLASVSGILSPLVVAHFTEQDETNLERWRPVFYIGSGIYVLSAIIFVVFGSTQVQAFNRIEDENLEDATLKNQEKYTIATVQN
ncbi:vesicular glutamate transporter 3-like [Plutella xylostella]|uniref:vesicular glutamate transporter 3-like n=1 Tax=Plutella xylostella TaxID=51655 RepID=UPI002032CD1C|nr:vesicular glutamate transporter 3-like [Plutella xylostella]